MNKSSFISILLDPNAQPGLGQAAEQPAAPAQAPDAQLSGGQARDIEFNPSNDLSDGGSPEGGSQAASGVSGVGGQGSQATDWESVVDVARNLGYDFGGREYRDDREFLRDVLTQATSNRQADYYAQLGRQLAPQYQQIQGYLQQQQAQAQQPQARQPWEAPEFNEQWLGLVDRDPNTGVFLAKPGVNPVIADKVNEFAKWRDNFTSNPIGAIRPFVEQNLPNLVQQQVQQQLAAYQTQQEVQGIIHQNSEWMYQHDANGQQVIGVGGRPVATPNGARYMQLVGELERSGMSSPSQIDRYAKQILMGELARNQVQQGQPAAPDAQAQNALASSRSQRNVLQALGAGQRQQTPGATEPEQQGLALRDRIRLAFDGAGYSEADFQNLDALAS